MDTGVVASLRRLSAAIGLAVATTLPTLAIPAAAAPFVSSSGIAMPASENAAIAVRDWRRGGGRHGWDRDRYWRRGYHHHRGFDRGAGLAVGLGVGLPLAAYLATRPAYDGGYDYYDRPYVVRRVPRPVYRTYTYADSHVQWCYGRYRSYRAYDNTFQPTYGPRRQCYSPYD